MRPGDDYISTDEHGRPVPVPKACPKCGGPPPPGGGRGARTMNANERTRRIDALLQNEGRADA